MCLCYVYIYFSHVYVSNIYIQHTHMYMFDQAENKIIDIDIWHFNWASIKL